jgi:hypothetical protein
LDDEGEVAVLGVGIGDEQVGGNGATSLAAELAAVSSSSFRALHERHQALLDTHERLKVLFRDVMAAKGMTAAEERLLEDLIQR